MMKNQREIYEALLAGETLTNIDTQKRVALDSKGNLTDVLDDIWETEDFLEFKSWHIFKEPKWYENIPDGGVLCWVSDGTVGGYPEIIISHEPETPTRYCFRSRESHYPSATPLTKAEIQVFIDNAPEDL